MEARRLILLDRSKSIQDNPWRAMVVGYGLRRCTDPRKPAGRRIWRRRFDEVWESQPAANGRMEDWSTVVEDVVI